MQKRQIYLTVALAMGLFTGCVEHREGRARAQFTIPPACVDSITPTKPDADCVDLSQNPNQTSSARCKDFVVQFHCVKVKK